MEDRRDARRMKRLALSLGVAALALVVVAPAVGAADAKTKRVSIKSGGGQVNGQSDDASISANGRYIAFSSGASDLVGNDTNSTTDIFVHDRVTKKTRRVSRRSNGAQGNGPSHSPSISANGRYVAFVSSASSLVGNDTNGHVDIFVHDRNTKKTRLVSKRTNGAQGNDHSSAPSISANGRYVAFRSDASNLVGGD
jgi:Tol biopolymer transport system component